MPPTTQFHLPAPVLPSHYPHHPIYAFCAGLHTLMIQVAPIAIEIGTNTERWSLVQKVPNQSSSTVENGDWFTAGVDSREVDSLSAKLRKTQSGDSDPAESLMAKLASTGDRLGESCDLLLCCDTNTVFRLCKCRGSSIRIYQYCIDSAHDK